MKFLLEYPIQPFEVNQFFGNKNPIYNGLGIIGHNGIDLMAIHGQNVYAAHDGEVSYVGVDNNEGYGVVIRTLEPFDYKDGQAYFKTIYWHLIKEIPVRVGQKVKRGDLIGYADNTGLSTGDHLHFGLKPQGVGENDWSWWNLEQNNGYFGAINPIPFLPIYEYFSKDLQMGDSGIEVEKLQAFLIRNKYLLPITKLGYYGELTRMAVFEFQLKNISLTWYEKYVLRGKRVGPKTRAILNV